MSNSAIFEIIKTSIKETINSYITIDTLWKWVNLQC